MFNKPIKYGLFLLAIITGINLIITAIFSMAWNKYASFSFYQFFFFFLAAFISGFLISIAIIFTAPVIKDYLATYRRMLRLESLSHPLLIKLSMEAPGTYHHSLTLANLAHKAARSVDADALITRVGAYYHDIGKIKNPQYFIENQRKGDINLHEELNDPKKSAEIIINHVKDGIELAKEYKLPEEVLAFIPEHHGTTKIKYFLEIAKRRGLKPEEKNYSYPGPKPLSIESVIIMLADTIEAKMRLIEKPNLEKITKIVYDSVQEKIDDNQLELSGINQIQLNKICISFIDTLSTMNHERIKYPKKENAYGKLNFKHK